MKSFLKKIIKEKKDEELTKLNAINLVNDVFKNLHNRESDVLSRRFALGFEKQHTLEEIGKLHSLTRERVRQIEKSSLDKIKKIENLDERLGLIRELVAKILDEHGGAMEREFLLDILSVLSLQINDNDLNDEKVDYKNYFDFILSKLLDDYIEKVDNSDKFSAFYKIKDKAVNYLEDLAEELRSKILDAKKTMKIEELLDMVKGLDSFNTHKDKLLDKIENIDLTKVFKDKIFPEKGEIINKNKTLYSIIQSIKDINRNKLGHWGHDSWPEVKPKRITDKIYLILKEENKPMHFEEIAKKINDIGFDHKKANKGSVHNELILDDRYILVDRGVYALKEWKK
ncbi:MAG: sigma factor-like helix-turn-helix DNA-binding protein [Patescibacteria group bacterium]